MEEMCVFGLEMRFSEVFIRKNTYLKRPKTTKNDTKTTRNDMVSTRKDKG
jgi:hypothetical protein